MNNDNSIGSRIFDVFNVIFLILVAFVTLYPFLYIISVSISDLYAVKMGKVKIWPVGLDFTAYKICLQNPDIWRAYLNTILYTATGTGLTVLMSSMTAYPLSKRELYGKKVIMIYIVITMFFSGGLIPTYLLILQLHMVNTIWALILPGAVSAWNVILFRTNFKQLPDALFDSAYCDGARAWTIYVKIILPLSKPIIATIALFSMVGFWNGFFQPLIYLNDVNKYPLQIYLRSLLIQKSFNSGYIDSAIRASRGRVENQSGLMTAIQMASIMISLGPILLIYPYAQKYFVKGVLVGSIKG